MGKSLICYAGLMVLPCSIMMPCPWVPGFAHHLKKNPKIDAGLHLTLTSEWTDYRWHPLTGKANPGLVDGEGAFWSSRSDKQRLNAQIVVAMLEEHG